MNENTIYMVSVIWRGDFNNQPKRGFYNDINILKMAIKEVIEKYTYNTKKCKNIDKIIDKIIEVGGLDDRSDNDQGHGVVITVQEINPIINCPFYEEDDNNNYLPNRLYFDDLFDD